MPATIDTTPAAELSLEFLAILRTMDEMELIATIQHSVRELEDRRKLRK